MASAQLTQGTKVVILSIPRMYPIFLLCHDGRCVGCCNIAQSLLRSACVCKLMVLCDYSFLFFGEGVGRSSSTTLLHALKACFEGQQSTGFMFVV